MADQRGLDRALARIFPIVNEQQAQNLIAQGGVRGNSGAFGNYNYNLITMPRIAGPWRGEVFRVERKVRLGRRSTSNYPLNNIWARIPRTQPQNRTPTASPPLQRRAGVRGGSPQRATKTTNSNNNGNVTSRRRQAPLERTNSSRPPPPSGNNAAGAVAVSPAEERRIQRNVAKQVAQMAPLQSQRWWTANEVRPAPVYPSIVSRGPTANQIIEQFRSNAFYARLAAENEAKRLKAKERRQAVKRVAGAVGSAALAGGRALISGISASGRAAKAGTLEAGRLTKAGVLEAGRLSKAGVLEAGRLTKAGALAASETAKRLVNMEMAWAEETQRRIEEAAARAAVEKAAKNKAAAEVAAKKAANAKAAAEEALKKATANKTARRAGLIWRAKARKSAAAKARNNAANWLDRQNREAMAANKSHNAISTSASNATRAAINATLKVMQPYTLTNLSRRNGRGGLVSTGRVWERVQKEIAEAAVAAKAAAEKAGINAAEKKKLKNEEERIRKLLKVSKTKLKEALEANELRRAKGKGRAPPKPQPTKEEINKLRRQAEQAETKAKKFANITQGAGSSGLTREQLRQSGAAANNARQAASKKAANNARQAEAREQRIEKRRLELRARREQPNELYAVSGRGTMGGTVLKSGRRALTPRS